MGMFYYRQTETGFSFRLAASNGATIGTSGVFASEKTCLDGIQGVRKFAPAAEIEDQTSGTGKKRKNPKYELYQDEAKEYRFRLIAKNGDTILSSPGYSLKIHCLDALEAVQNGALTADVIREEAATPA